MAIAGASALGFTLTPSMMVSAEGEESAPTSIVEEASEEIPEESKESAPEAVSEASEAAASESVAPTSESASDTSASASSLSWEEWLSQWLSPQTITAIVSIITALGAVLKMASSIKDLHAKNQLTIKNVTEAVQKELPDEVKKACEPYMEKINQNEENIVKVLEVLSKVLALSQENTPESRVAILNAIQELGNVQADLTEQAKEVIAQQEKEKAEQSENAQKALSSIEEEASSYDGTSI